MRAVFGLLLVMLGLAMAIVWMPDSNSERQLAVVTDIATSGIGRRTASGEADRNGRTFSPATPLIATVEPPPNSAVQYTIGVARVVAPAPGSGTPGGAERTESTSSVTSVVAQSGPGATVNAVMPGRTDLAAAGRQAPLSDAARYELVRNLQRELKRVGCYYGEIDGDWGTGSRRAMSSFTDRVNASLPIDQPDFVLLALVQNSQGAVCGRGCPAGQTVNSSGRCVAGAVVANARRGSDRRDGNNTTLAEDVVQSSTSQTATAAPTATGGWTTDVARSTSEAGIAGAAVALAAAAAVAPPSGRMAVGGPLPAAPGYAAPRNDSPARAIVRAYPSRGVETSPEPSRPVAQSAERRERPRRARAETRFGGPVAVYRGPRSAPVYAAAPRRSRNWTASFFGFP